MRKLNSPQDGFAGMTVRGDVLTDKDRSAANEPFERTMCGSGAAAHSRPWRARHSHTARHDNGNFIPFRQGAGHSYFILHRQRQELSCSGCASKPGTQRRLLLCDKKQSPFAVWSDGTFGNQTKRCAAAYPFRFP